MVAQSKTDVIAVQEVDSSLEHGVPDSNGVVSSKTYRYDETPDEELDWIYEANPGFVMEIRPDYVKRKHPDAIN